MTKIIIAGGRDFTLIDSIHYELYKLIQDGHLPNKLELVCGMAKGADITAKKLFNTHHLKVHKRPADWQDMTTPCVPKHNKYGGLYNALAGMKRNHAMGDEADVLLAFWDGKSKGTKDMIDYMTKLGKPVFVVNY